MSSILKTIEEHYDKFTADPDYKNGLKRINHQKLQTATKGLNEKIGSFANYYVYLRHMRTLKITRGKLSEEAEKNLVHRGKQALDDYRHVASSISEIGKLAAESGFEMAVNRHIEPLCQHLNHNPKIFGTLNELKSMGITEGEIGCVTEELSQKKFNILKYGKADGTLSGFAAYGVSLTPALEKQQRVMEEHGLPVIEGAGASGTVVGVAVGFAVVAGILCIITVFYA
jgi:hypothetical protein